MSKRYPCQVCKVERMFSPRRKKCGRCVRLELEKVKQ